MKKNSTKTRCAWVDLNNPLYIKYHDEEWGKPVHDDSKLFELLILEGAQAGLNWATVLKKREAYRKAFKQFDPSKVAKMTDKELEKLLLDEGLIRNRLKIFSARRNAKVFIQIQKEFGSFDKYLWAMDNKDEISKDLKKRGMNFVGTTIIYAYMQAIGMVNDHEANCWKYKN